ncbi:MAG: hypothetical protein ACE5GM_09705, partial [bacterium]
MRIKRIVVYRIIIPFEFSFATAQVNRVKTNNIIARVETTDNVYGYGESTPRSYVTGETACSAMKTIVSDLAPYLIGREIKDVEDAKSILS